MNRLQVLGQVPAQAELVGEFTALVADDGKAELIAALGLAAVRGGLRRDGDQRCAACLDFEPRLFERLKVEITIGTPAPR